jgi:hypothetical protein
LPARKDLSLSNVALPDRVQKKLPVTAKAGAQLMREHLIEGRKQIISSRLLWQRLLMIRQHISVARLLMMNDLIRKLLPLNNLYLA